MNEHTEETQRLVGDFIRIIKQLEVVWTWGRKVMGKIKCINRNLRRLMSPLRRHPVISRTKGR